MERALDGMLVQHGLIWWHSSGLTISAGSQQWGWNTGAKQPANTAPSAKKAICASAFVTCLSCVGPCVSLPLLEKEVSDISCLEK